MNPTESSNELLRSELHTVRYELQTLRGERQLELLEHSRETGSLQSKLEEYAKQIDTIETEKRFLFDKQEELTLALKNSELKAKSNAHNFEQQLRSLKLECAEFKESLSDKIHELETERRECRREVVEYSTRAEAKARVTEDLRLELESMKKKLRDNRNNLNSKDTEVRDLEMEILNIKTQNSDDDTLRLVMRELSEQVQYIKSLEGIKRRQTTEIKQLYDSMKRLEFVEEEKRSLGLQVIAMQDLRIELSKAELRASVLQDEKNSWASYLQNQDSLFDTPESLANAFLEQQMENLALVEKIGQLDPEIALKDRKIFELECSVRSLSEEVSDLQGSHIRDMKARERLERQRSLALKEAQFLREQLKSLGFEEMMNIQDNFDRQQSERIRELEKILDSYKAEVDLLKISSSPHLNEPSITNKLPLEVNQNEELGNLQQENRQFKEEISNLEKRNNMCVNEISALKFRISSMESTSIRALELKDNPTSNEQAIKASQLASLREENSALLNQLEGRFDKLSKVVPRSTLENAKAEIKQLEKIVAEKEKRMTRLKEIWSTKSMELREAVYSLLGWKFDFMPNGRVKVTHMFAGSEDQSIEFDGEKGTMRVSGGSDSIFHKEIRNNCSFWMARQSIPCLLASVLIEQYEKTTRAQI